MDLNAGIPEFKAGVPEFNARILDSKAGIPESIAGIYGINRRNLWTSKLEFMNFKIGVDQLQKGFIFALLEIFKGV